jgi:uncharacterized membrane protein
VLPRLLRHAIAVVPVVLAVLWCGANEMVEGAGSALQIGWLGDARHAPVWTFMLSLGPAVLVALVGMAVPATDKGSPGFRLQAEATLAIVSLLLMYFVRLNVDASWVGFRAGQMFLVAIPALIARGFAAAGRSRTIAAAAATVALALGSPTLAIDVYNAQDITNFSQSPIGPWTVVITHDERDALDWIRRTTPSNAVVQMDPSARGRETWSLIPSFAGRRMAAGLPISLLNTPEYREKSERVRMMFSTPDPHQAFDIARSLRIDYVYVDRVERAAYPQGVAKFDRAPDLFAPAYRNGEVSIYRVQ